MIQASAVSITSDGFHRKKHWIRVSLVSDYCREKSKIYETRRLTWRKVLQQLLKQVTTIYWGLLRRSYTFQYNVKKLGYKKKWAQRDPGFAYVNWI